MKKTKYKMMPALDNALLTDLESKVDAALADNAAKEVELAVRKSKITELHKWCKIHVKERDDYRRRAKYLEAVIRGEKAHREIENSENERYIKALHKTLSNMRLVKYVNVLLSCYTVSVTAILFYTLYM